MPLATVILNSYNQERFLAEAIESALGQTVADIELVVVDNGSTDGSREVIRGYEGDSRIRTFLHDRNAAVTRRFNEAVAEARGEFISFLYSDDVLLPEKLELQLEAFAGLPADYGVVYSPAQGLNTLSGKRWDYGSVATSGWVFENLLRDHWSGQIDMASPLTRRSALLQHRFYEDIFAEGEGVFFRIALTHRFHYLDTPLVVLRDHGGNAGKAVRKNADMTMVMLDRLERHPDLPPGADVFVRAFRGRLLRSYAWQGARLGEDPRWVRARAVEAVRLRPTMAVSPRTLGAVALSAMPGAAQRGVNAIGTSVRASPGNTTLGAGFGGADVERPINHQACQRCPLCDGPPRGLAFPYETQWEEQRYLHRSCASCGTTYVDPVPTPEQLAGVYSWEAYHQPQYGAVDLDRYQLSVRTLARLRPPSTIRLLDFGCGAGGFLVVARAAGYDCRGVEHDAAVAAQASAHAGVPVDQLGDAVAAGRRFDVVVLRDVLPHLVDPASTLRTLEGLLHDGGVFFFDGPLEEGRSLVRLAAGSLKAVRRRVGLDSVGVTPPTMLFRVNATGQRRFLVDRMGYREHLFEAYETGWPYHVPGRRPTSTGMALKEATGRLAMATASVTNRAGLGLSVGNRFFGMYQPRP